jgi:hypothetical protein
MKLFQVEKEQFPVEITMRDGDVLEVNVFLVAISPSSGHRQSLWQLLDDEAKFIPVVDGSGAFVMVSKNMISAIAIAIDDDPTPNFSRKFGATLNVYGVGEMEGNLIVPEGPAAFRVSDFLNGDERWFRIEVEDKVLMIYHDALAQVQLHESAK